MDSQNCQDREGMEQRTQPALKKRQTKDIRALSNVNSVERKEHC